MAIPIIVNKLHLASASPRRAEILSALGLTFTAQGVDIDESHRPPESARDMVVRLAMAKARAAMQDDDWVVLGSDTVVVVDARILGKPAGAAHAAEMLNALSGRAHTVMTGVCVLSGEEAEVAVSTTEVRFREIGRDEIGRYWQSGEPCDKAGGYAIQGLGGAFVQSISGSYSGVVGLPVFETAQLLEKKGIRCF